MFTRFRVRFREPWPLQDSTRVVNPTCSVALATGQKSDPFYNNHESYFHLGPELFSQGRINLEESLASTERRVAEHGSCTLNIDMSSESRSILEPLLPPEVEGNDMSLPPEVEVEVEGNDMSLPLPEVDVVSLHFYQMCPREPV
nr:hypothetical protein CFP56_29183 [Quercus suber]